MSHDNAQSEPTRSKAGLFEVRNIVGALLFLYGVILLAASFGTSDAQKAKANGINANLWVGLVLIVFGALMVVWAVTRPIVVDEEQLERDKRAVEEATAQSRRAAHHEVDGDAQRSDGERGSAG
jgi:formate hydrogenlyase subunit 3/multisubunit Na+/H+ antiporter MnhD subunit